MPSSGVSVQRGRDDDVERRLGIVAAILWVAALGLSYWNDQYRLAPSEGLVLALGLAVFVLTSVAMPLAVGAYVAWRQRVHAHRVLTAAGVAVLAEWAWFAVGAGIRFIVDPQGVASYVSREQIEFMVVLLVFGVVAGAMGAVGGAVMAYLHRRLARIGSPLPLH